MNTKEPKKATSLRLNKDLYLKIEKRAKKENRSISNLLETIISQALNYNEPNEETVQAIKDAKSEKNLLKGYTDVNNLFEDLVK